MQNRINQIQDPVTGDTVGGVTVNNSDTNNFSFQTGTTGNTSYLEVNARFGLDDVDLAWAQLDLQSGQATNDDGVALLLIPKELLSHSTSKLVDGYYPLILIANHIQ